MYICVLYEWKSPGSDIGMLVQFSTSSSIQRCGIIENVYFVLYEI